MGFGVRSAAKSVRTAALCAGALLILGACGGTDDADTIGAGTDSSPAAPVTVVDGPDVLSGSVITDSADLQARMLTPSDLPDGYAVVPDPVRDLGLDPAPEYDSPDRSGTEPQECADVLAAVGMQSAGASAMADVRYSGPNFSSIDEDAASYAGGEDGVGGAGEAFRTVQNTLVGCTEYSGTDADGIDVDFSLSARDQSPVGDASTSFRLATTSEGFTLVSDVVISVVDHTVFQLSVTSQEGVDAASFTALAETAAERIRGDLGS